MRLKIKHVISLLLSLLMIVTLVSPAIADNSSNNTDPQVMTYNKLHHSSHSEKVTSLTQLGLSGEDAQYYATLDDNVLQAENAHKYIDLSNAQPLSTEEMVYNQAGFRKKVLNLDPAAIKAGLKSEVYTHGFADMYKLMKQNPGQSKYEISYPDGSKIGFVSSNGGVAKTPKTPVERQGDDYYGPSYGYGSDWGYYNFWGMNQSPGWFNGGYDYWYLSSSIGTTMRDRLTIYW
jgi:hypothetical protein